MCVCLCVCVFVCVIQLLLLSIFGLLNLQPTEKWDISNGTKTSYMIGEMETLGLEVPKIYFKLFGNG